jgi:16S rRNA (guanine527-N7)-methyltransferase
MREKYRIQLESLLNAQLPLKSAQGGTFNGQVAVVIERLIDYLFLLEKWNKVYNLTSIRNLDEMFTKHILDSLVVAPYVADNKKMIDVGTGGGLPGVVLAILFPEMQVDLLDSNSKKTRFLIQAKAELSLKNVQVIQERVEKYSPNELYDGVISRAFTALNDMLNLTEHLLTADGSWWAMKSQKTSQEIESLPKFAEIAKVFDLNVPNLNAERTLIQLTRTNS